MPCTVLRDLRHANKVPRPQKRQKCLAVFSSREVRAGATPLHLTSGDALAFIGEMKTIQW